MIRIFSIYLTEEETNRVRGINQYVNGLAELESFYIVEYITRYLRKSKNKNLEIKGGKIRSVGICLSSDKAKINLSLEHKTLFYYSTINYLSDIAICRSDNRREKFLLAVEEAVPEFSKLDTILGKEIQNAINSFRANDYKNIWIHQKKRIKGIGTAKLVCELTVTEFTLNLVVENKEKLIYKKTLMITRPDSSLYHHRFKTLHVGEDSISVTDRIWNNPFFSISIKDTLERKDGTYLNPNQEHRDEDEEFASMGLDFTKIPKGEPIADEDPKWWAEFKECLKTPEGTPCPSLK